MPQKNKNTYRRRGKCQCSHIDNQTKSNVQQSTKSIVTNNSCFLQKVLTKVSTLTKENMIMPLMKGLCSFKNVIIKNGIKYILHLLHFYLFKTIFSIFLDSKEHIQTKHTELCKENHEEQHTWKQINQKQTIKNKNSNDRPFKKFQNVEKDSDFTGSQSNNAGNATATNMPLNYKNIDNNTSQTVLEKPMDISTEQHSFNKAQLPINTSQNTKSFADERSNVIGNNFPKWYTQEAYGNSSANKEIPHIFRQKYTSSDSSASFPKSFESYKYKKSRQTNFFCYGGNSKFSNSLIRPQLQKDEAEQEKGQSIKFTPTNEEKKFTLHNEKYMAQRNRNKTQGKWYSFRQYGPTQYKSHYSRIHLGNKRLRRNNLRYKEKGTQTDIIFATNYDIDMSPFGTMWSEQQIYRCATDKSQDKDMNQELNYTANEEKSVNELLTIAYEQLPSYCKSSSSTDINFNAHTSTTPHNDIAARLLSTNLSNNINTFKTSTRAPPGFPDIPQNPPLTSYVTNPQHLMPPSSKNNYISNSRTKSVTVIPPAPPPMRHLYYNYPEFMEPPTCTNSSNVFH